MCAQLRYLHKECRCGVATFDLKNVCGRKVCWNLPMRGGILFASTEVVHRHRFDSRLHFDIRNIWQIRTQKQNASTLCLLLTDVLQRWPQVCRVKITFTKPPTKLFRLHNNKFEEMPCKLDSTENPRSFEKSLNPPYGGIGYFPQWNPVYNVISSKFLLWKRNDLSVVCKRDLDAANLRPALEQSCGKQTPRDRKLFFRANLLYVPNIKM